MVDILLRDAAKQGYVPDSSVAGDQVTHDMGFRPAPFMLYKNLLEMGVWPIQSVVKVIDIYVCIFVVRYVIIRSHY